MKRNYPAVIDKDGDSFGITFPDFPGCVSAATTPEEAMVMGAEALAGHIALMAADGDAIPEPTPLERVTWRPDENVLAVTLVAVVIPGRAKRINITLDEGLIQEIDCLTGNRSGFLADAARAEIVRRRSA
ncbi:MAG: type II toxin-antitoxin system HicB family antitoxin [Alphaproteobacteria bacterium]|nr:type II toxin-antitoxin system HicB family antitoxin [Alphaproteobacteria bacterium]